MIESKKAYELSIDEGKVRAVIKVEDIKVDVRNSANEFISMDEDDVHLFLDFTDLDIKTVKKNGYELLYPLEKNTETKSLSLKKDNIWFDVDINNMSSILNNSIQFSISGKHPSHISYFIKKLDYKIEWLQYDKQKDSISTVSVTKGSFVQPEIESNVNYSLEEISSCAELLSRAIKKIDLRTGSSYVRINTEDGKYNSLLIVMAKQLGYQVEVLDDDTIKDLQKRGRKATHIISLIINY
jgi:hypothetical protein